MKKLSLLATPLMAISLLANCGSFNPKYNFVFEGTNCSINGKNNYSEQVKENESRVYTVRVDNYELLPISISDIPDGIIYSRSKDGASATLTINKMQNNYTVKVTATKIPITITFKKSLRGEVIKISDCDRGTKWEDVDKPPLPEESDLVFDGWSFDSSFSGDVILDEYIFLNDMVVYPSYSYNCSLKSQEGDECSLQIDQLSGKYGQDLEVALSVKPDKIAKYDLPPLADKDYRFDISTSKETTIDDNLVVYKVTPQRATLTIKNEDNILNNCGKITIAVRNYRPTYIVKDEASGRPSSHLKFTSYTYDNLYAATKGDEYKFNVEVVEDSTNETQYYVPRRFNIFLGNSSVPIDESFYEVDRDDDRKNAIVTIKENVINADVTISGSANKGECYSYEVFSLGGIKPVDLGYKSINDSYTIQLEKDTSEGEYGYPQGENIYVNDAKADMIYPITSKPDQFSYDQIDGKLTIRHGSVNDSFAFLLAADEYPILEKASWDDIRTISDNGYAPYFFRVGELKSIDVGGVSHQIRIIGFNHDDLADGSGKKAGITFEFAELLSVKNGDNYLRVTIDWGVDNYSFPDQHINGYYNGDVYDRLPSELQNVLKNVSKETTLEKPHEDPPHLLTTYQAKLFPLSYEEMTKDPNEKMGLEGFIYKYYEEHDSGEYRKKYASHQEGRYAEYWLRSFPLGTKILAGCCRDIGDFGSVPIIFAGCERAVAPAFCI